MVTRAAKAGRREKNRIVVCSLVEEKEKNVEEKERGKRKRRGTLGGESYRNHPSFMIYAPKQERFESVDPSWRLMLKAKEGRKLNRLG